jgi:hypothetical protein
MNQLNQAMNYTNLLNLLSVVYSFTDPCSGYSARNGTRRLLNNKLRSSWKESTVALVGVIFRHLSGDTVEGHENSHSG